MRTSQGGQNALREIRRGVAEAGDAQVLQVVRMVDALEIRGTTDAVLVPVRARLRAMQPARPLRFARLLFMPADPLIVPPAAWRPGGPQLPRHAIPVLADAVRSILGAVDSPGVTRDALAQVDSLITNRMTSDLAVVQRAGALLWPLASRALRRLADTLETRESAACLSAWRDQGLPEIELQPVVKSLSGVLAFALKLQDAGRAGSAPIASVLGEALVEAETLGNRATSMMLSLWLIRAPQTGGQILASAPGSATPRQLCDAAADAALTWLETESGAAPNTVTACAAEELNRQVSLLDALAAQSPHSATRRRIAQLTTSLLGQAVQRFDTSLRDMVETGLAHLPTQNAQRNAALMAMEEGARHLRSFELEARRLGGGPKLSALVCRAQSTLRKEPSLSLIERARLVELLAGPEAALICLREGA